MEAGFNMYLICQDSGIGLCAYFGDEPKGVFAIVPPELETLAAEQPYNFFYSDGVLEYKPLTQPDSRHVLENGVWVIMDSSQEKAMIWESIKELRTKIQHSGVTCAGKWFHSDAESRIQFLGLVMMGDSIPPNLQWKTMDGTFVTMTKALATGIFQTISMHDMQCHAVSESHKANVFASKYPETYNYNQGWPQTWTK